MNDGLEALEEIKGNCDLFDEGYQWDNEFSKQFDSDIDSIENELKDYYALKKECEEAKWYQEHKALNILKETCTFKFEEKDIMVHNKIIKVYEVVINGVLTLDLTKEQFDSLREVLE